MGLLNWLDLAIVAFYLIGVTYVGARFYSSGANMQEYLRGSKSMAWFPVALSILASKTSAISYLGVPAWSFQHDTRLHTHYLTYLFAVPLVALIFVPVYAKGNLYTAYEYLERRFDLRVRLIGGLIFMAIRGTTVAVILYAPALMMSELMGIPLPFSVLAMGVLTTLYTSLGGIKAVIWTDAIQVATVLTGFGAIAWSVVNRISGGLQAGLEKAAVAGKLQFVDASLNLDRVDNFWAMLLGSTAVFVQTMGTDQAVLQKFLATRSAADAKRSLYFHGAVLMLLMAFLSVLGVLLYVLYAQYPELRTSLKNQDAVVPHYAANMLPHGLAGLVVASIFAAAMATLSAGINSLATSSVVDFYKRLFRPGRTDHHYTTASRVATILWGAISTAGALFADRLGPLLVAPLKVQTAFGGVILGIFLLGILTARTRATAAVMGAGIGLTGVILICQLTSVSAFWCCIIGCAITMSVGWFASTTRGQERPGQLMESSPAPLD